MKEEWPNTVKSDISGEKTPVGSENNPYLRIESLKGDLAEAYKRLHREIERRGKIEEALKDRLRFEKLLFDLSARFINIDSELIDLEIENAFGRIREFFHADTCGLLKIEQDGSTWKITHISSAEGLPDLPVNVDLPVGLFPWVFKKIVDRHEVHTFSSVYELPPEANIDRQTYEEWGIRSNVNIPISVDGSSDYNLGIASHYRERVWPEDYVPRLRMLGEIIVKSLQLAKIQSRLEERRKFDGLVSDISAGMVINAAEGFEGKINNWLGRIAEFFDADRCSLRLFYEDNSRLGSAFEYHREGTDPVPASIFREELPWYTEQLTRGKTVAIDRLDDFPIEAEKERRYCLIGGMKSILSVPMKSEGKIIGAFALASVRAERDWPQHLVLRMRFVADVFAGALARKQMDKQLQERLREIGLLKRQLEEENIYLKKEIELQHVHEEIVGRSPAMKTILAQIEQVAQTDATVLIEGETGVGKELVAKAVHRLSPRKDRPLVTVNCASLPPSLIESELFGREKGAYTGAMTRMTGRFEAADGATLFLDEIGELPQEIQAKLLRVLEEGRFERLGSSKTLRVDARVIAATNRDLARESAEGNFRKDLYYRLNVFPIVLPPLRERPEDVPVLVWSFIRQFEKKMGKRIDHIPRKCMEELMHYPWPGNARELRNAVEHSMILSSGKTLEVLPPRKTSSEIPSSLNLEDVERGHILGVLQKSGWRISGSGGAADMLGLKRTTLQSKMKKLGIRRPSK